MDFSHTRRRWLQGVGVCAAAVLMAGCASGTGGAARPALPGAGTDKEALRVRAKAYWDALQKNDKVAAWAFEAVSKDPKWTLEAYLQRGGTVIDAIEVRDVQSLDGDEAVVHVWMRYSVPVARVKNLEVVEQDHWRLMDGEWRHVLKQSIMFAS